MPFYFPARQIEIIYYPGVITAAALYLQASGKNLCLYWCTELNITNWRTRNLWQPSTFPVFVTLIVIVTLTQVDKSCHLFSKARHFHHWWLRLMYSYRCEMWDVRDIELCRAVSPLSAGLITIVFISLLNVIKFFLNFRKLNNNIPHGCYH